MYLVTFYTLQPGSNEAAITVHRVTPQALGAYINAPWVMLGAARGVNGEPKADGFRVVDAEGRIVLDYIEQQ